jgi:hypothetical protein
LMRQDRQYHGAIDLLRVSSPSGPDRQVLHLFALQNWSSWYSTSSHKGKQVEEECTWTHDEFIKGWEIGCGGLFFFVLEDSPEDNLFRFCPRCGNKLKQASDPHSTKETTE